MTQRLTPAQIRAIRGAQTQAEFAHELGCHGPEIISRWENGRQPIKVFRTLLIAMAKKRNVSLD